MASSNSSSGSALADMFSDANRSKFERKSKPAELVPTKRVEPAVEKKIKKKKWRQIAREEAENAALGQKEEAEETDAMEDDNEQSASKGDQSARTVFIGNVPLTQSIKSIKKLCSEYGKVESVRLRSVPTAGTKVDEAGNQDLVKKVCSNHRQFGEQKGSFNAYVVFKEAESVAAALEANNRVLDDRHLRFDTATPSHFDPKKTVFVGSLQHYCDEEELREHFAEALTNGHDDIESVRIIRDTETLVGKGFAYVLLKNREAVLKALELNEQLFKKRALRVAVCGKRTKRATEQENIKKRAIAAAAASEDDQADDGNGTEMKEGGNDENERGREKDKFEGSKKRDRSRSKSGEKTIQDINALNASKRIKLKAVETRKKFLIAHKQKKATPGRKGKRLGGVVKRAMKAAKTKQ